MFEKYKLKWNNFSEHLELMLKDLYESGIYSDVLDQSNCSTVHSERGGIPLALRLLHLYRLSEGFATLYSSSTEKYRIIKRNRKGKIDF